MNDKATQDGDERGGSVTKAAASIAALLYVAGYAVVSLHLSRLNVYPIELIRFHYLAAGLWLFVPLVLFALPFVWLGAVLHDAYGKERTSAASRRGSVWRVVVAIPVHAFRIVKSLIMALGTFIIAAFIAYAANSELLYLLEPLAEFDFIAHYLLSLALFAVGLVATGFATWLFLRDFDPKAAAATLNDLLWGLLFASFATITAFGYLGHFTVNVYPRLPATLGGGAPIPVRFVLSDDACKSHTPLTIDPGLVHLGTVPAGARIRQGVLRARHVVPRAPGLFAEQGRDPGRASSAGWQRSRGIGSGPGGGR